MKNKKIFVLVIFAAAIIIAGIVMNFVKGFTFDSYYSGEISVNYKDIVNQFIKPVIISLICVLVFFAIKYRKQEWYKKLILTIATISIIELVILSIIVICGVPLSIYIMPVLIGAYVLTILGLSFCFEKK